jgi:CPA1 family monovalent cation:H+ antiporter
VIAVLRSIGICRHFTPLGTGCTTVLGWAGMRGVVTLAVALSVPEGFPGRDFMLVTAFAVILIPVLLQGTTLGAVIRKAGLVEPEAERVRLTASDAEAAMALAQVALIESRAYDEDGNLVHPQLLERYRRKARIFNDYAGKEADYAPRVQAHFGLILEAIAAGRAELIRLHRAGDIDERTLHDLERVLDLEELTAQSALS